MHPARLFVLCGLPGSGTTSRAEVLVERFSAVWRSADDMMEALGVDLWDTHARAAIEAHQLAGLAHLLRSGTSVVVEWGSWHRAERDHLRRTARDAGAFVHLEVLGGSLDELWERLRTRGREERLGGRAITRDDLEAWAREFERPTADELARFDPMPPVRAAERPGSPSYPYGSWRP